MKSSLQEPKKSEKLQNLFGTLSQYIAHGENIEEVAQEMEAACMDHLSGGGNVAAFFDAVRAGLEDRNLHILYDREPDYSAACAHVETVCSWRQGRKQGRKEEGVSLPDRKHRSRRYYPFRRLSPAFP